MNQYIGTKIVLAEPAVKAGYDGYFVKYPDGYTSWSPKEVFEEAYRLSNGMPFGLALEAARKGHKVARASWPPFNHLVFEPESEFRMPALFHVQGELKRVWLTPQMDLLSDDWKLVD